MLLTANLRLAVSFPHLCYDENEMSSYLIFGHWGCAVECGCPNGGYRLGERFDAATPETFDRDCCHFSGRCGCTLVGAAVH
jgi:hypothetical protein